VLHEILAMAQIKMRYASAATKREVEALQKSDEVRQAKSLLVSSAQNTAKLRNRFNDDLREDPDLIAARKAVYDQKVAYVASHAYLDGLYEARGIAMDYAYFVRGYNPYRVMGYDPYGFRYSYYGYNYYPPPPQSGLVQKIHKNHAGTHTSASPRCFSGVPTFL
jgi:hypothetical protein